MKARTPSKPASWSAAATARAISRKLRRAGVPMSARAGRGGHRSRGYRVARVGWSSTVAIDYDCGIDVFSSLYWLPARVEERRAAMVQARHWATAQGYTMDNRGWTGNGCYIKCERE
jgi:hypothetical protein